MLLTFLIATLIIYVWRNRSVLGAHYFLLTLTLVEVWIIAQALEMSAVDLHTKIIWANIQYMPAMLTPLTYLYLTLQFTRRENWLHRRWLPFLLLLPAIAFNILAWTNDLHGLIRQNIHLELSGSFPTIGKTYGPLFLIFSAYNYSIIIYTLITLSNAFSEKMSLYRKQIAFLFVALLLPIISNLLQITGLNPFYVDITPPFFGVSALIIFWGIFRYRLFNIIPIARSIIIQEIRTGMIVLDNEGRILDINPAAVRILNLTSESLIGHWVETALSGTPELIDIYKEGKDTISEMTIENSESRFCYEISFTQIKNLYNDSIGQLLQIYDITERKIAEEIIQYAALHDDLTGLPNRNYFQVLFSQELALARMRREPLTVAFLDLDNFKTINDTYGHNAGDRVLCLVAERLKGVLRESDILSRIGGDEFAIISPHITNDENIKIIGNKILDIFGKSFNLFEVSLQIRASIGFSVFPRDGENIEILLKKADKAMYSIKSGIKNNYCIYKE